VYVSAAVTSDSTQLTPTRQATRRFRDYYKLAIPGLSALSLLSLNLFTAYCIYTPDHTYIPVYTPNTGHQYSHYFQRITSLISKNHNKNGFSYSQRKSQIPGIIDVTRGTEMKWNMNECGVETSLSVVGRAREQGYGNKSRGELIQ
jgi:hypothetical protein